MRRISYFAVFAVRFVRRHFKIFAVPAPEKNVHSDSGADNGSAELSTFFSLQLWNSRRNPAPKSAPSHVSESCVCDVFLLNATTWLQPEFRMHKLRELLRVSYKRISEFCDNYRFRLARISSTILYSSQTHTHRATNPHPHSLYISLLEHATRLWNLWWIEHVYAMCTVPWHFIFRSLSPSHTHTHNSCSCLSVWRCICVWV